MSKNILVLAAHPDDEILGCGGTMSKMMAAGDTVSVAILGEGITSRHDTREQGPPEAIQALREASRRANACLGVTQVDWYDLPDNRFDSVPLLDIVKRVERIIEEVQPVEVYTQHGGDLNIDHGCLFRATMTALRPMAETRVERLYAYEVASSTEYAFKQFAPVFSPNHFVDISEQLEAKIAAMECYESEARLPPHPRSPEALRAWATFRGSNVGYHYAESFQLIWSRS